MTDLTKITTPFGLLDAETQEALRAHEGPHEFLSPEGEWIEDPWDEYNEFKFHSLWSDQQVAEKVASQLKGVTKIDEIEVDPKECPIRHSANYAAFTANKSPCKREEIYFSPVVE